MRRLLLALLLLPAAAATPPSEPYLFDATLSPDPAVGVPAELMVRVDARRPLDAPLALQVPPWVEVEGALEWHAQADEGESIERAWRVTATRAGFWRASLAVDASRAAAYANPVDPERAWQLVHGCCILAWSTEGRGLASMRPEGAIPGESTVGFHPSLRALDTQTAELAVRVSPQDARYAEEELLFQSPVGSPELQRAPADAARTFAHAFALAHNQTVVLSAAAYVGITFEGGEHAGEDASWSQHVACANLEATRDGDDVRETRRWGCEALGGRRHAIPALATLVVAMVLALAARSAYPRGPR